MKSIVPPLAVLAATLFGFIPESRAEVSPFRLRVEQVTKTDSEKFAKTQHRTLKMFVSNSSKEPAELRAKYIFFGHTASSSEISKIDEGEKAVSVGPLATEMVESGLATAKFDEAHSTGGYSSKGKSMGSKGPAPKKVEASGDKITGYGVQLYKGETMVAEYYDPPSGKEEWARAYPIKLPTTAKKK